MIPGYIVQLSAASTADRNGMRLAWNWSIPLPSVRRSCGPELRLLLMTSGFEPSVSAEDLACARGRPLRHRALCGSNVLDAVAPLDPIDLRGKLGHGKGVVDEMNGIRGRLQQKAVVLAAVALAAVALAACGSNGSAGSASSGNSGGA